MGLINGNSAVFVLGNGTESEKASVYSLLHIRMAKELAADNQYLKQYGVELEEATLRVNNPNLFLLKTIEKTVMRLLWDCRKEINEDNYHVYYNVTNRFFDALFFTLPEDIEDKKYVAAHKSYALPTIATFMQQQLCKPNDTIPADIYWAVKGIDWTGSRSYWEKYAGVGQPIPGRNGSQLIMKALIDNLPKVAATTR